MNGLLQAAADPPSREHVNDASPPTFDVNPNCPSALLDGLGGELVIVTCGWADVE